MAYDLEEQDQIDALKAFWKKYGNFLLGAISVALLAFAGYRYYESTQANKSAQAVALYDEVREAALKNDLGKAKTVAGQLFEKFGDTAYADMTGLLMAKLYIDGKDEKSAKASLQALIDKGRDDDYKHIARVRLAGILLDEKAYDEALKLVASDSAGKFSASYADRRADIQVASGKVADAKASYKLALEKMEPNSPMRRVVQLKLDSLGE